MAAKGAANIRAFTLDVETKCDMLVLPSYQIIHLENQLVIKLSSHPVKYKVALTDIYRWVFTTCYIHLQAKHWIEEATCGFNRKIPDN